MSLPDDGPLDTKMLEQFLSEIDDKQLEAMSEEELLGLRKEMNIFGRTVECGSKYLAFSIVNIRDKYMERLLTTALIGYLNRACDEWHVPEGIPVTPVYEYLKDEKSIYKCLDNIKDPTEKYMRDVNDNAEWMKKRVVVKEFLEELFQFNPDVHVRSSYRPQPSDKNRLLLDTLAANLAVEHWKKIDPQFCEIMLAYDRAQALVAMAEVPDATMDVAAKLVTEKHYSEVDYASMSDEDKHVIHRVCEMIPPDDMFYKFRNYMVANYDKLREAVTHLYCMKSDLEYAILPYAMFDTEEEVFDFQKKHCEEVIADIYKAKTSCWNILTPFEKVSSTTRYFNNNTIVMEEILNQVERDAKMGKEMMKNRIFQAKRKNILESGPDAPMVAEWINKNPHLSSLGAYKPNRDSYADLECPKDAVQVDVWKIAKGGLDVTKSKFYTKAVEPELPDDEKNQ